MRDPKMAGIEAVHPAGEPVQGEAKVASNEGSPGALSLDLPPIPVALEHVIGMAAASPAFAEVLRTDRKVALGAAGLAMTPSEQAILAAVPEPVLSQMVSRMDARLDAPDRRRFLELGAMALATLLGSAAVAGCSKKEPSSKASSPKSDPPLRDEPGAPEPARDPSEGARDAALPPTAHKGDAGAAGPTEEPLGRPAAEAGPERPAEAGPERSAQGAPVQPRPRVVGPPSMDGIRPRPRPQQPHPTRGVRPDYNLELPMSRGISPRGGRRSGTPGPDDL